MYVCVSLTTEAVNSAFLQVSNNNTVKVGSEEELVASAEGRYDHHVAVCVCVYVCVCVCEATVY